MLFERDFLRVNVIDIEVDQRKTCSTCKIEKPISEFTGNKNQPSGYMCYCKSCNSKRNKKYREDPENLTKACKRIYGYISRRIRLKGLDNDFNASFIKDLYNRQNGVCAYTGDKLSLRSGLPSTLSVDRINSSLGYTKDNVTLVTWEVNNAKQDSSMDGFVSLCKKVLDHGKV